MIHSKEINACFRNHLISSSFIILFSRVFCPRNYPLKCDIIWPYKVPKIFAEILHNDNDNSYTRNSNSKVDNIRIMHNSNNGIDNSNSNRLNEIVRTSSYPSINAKCV